MLIENELGGYTMSKKVYIFLADGFEDIEGLTVVDLMRRAGITITTVSIKNRSPQPMELPC